MSSPSEWHAIANTNDDIVDQGYTIRTWLYFRQDGYYSFFVHDFTNEKGNMSTIQDNRVTLHLNVYDDILTLKDSNNGNSNKTDQSLSFTKEEWYYLELDYDPGNHSARLKTPNSGVKSLNLNSNKFTGDSKYIGLAAGNSLPISEGSAFSYWDEIGIGKKL